ncbi:MAG: hypothetical protein QOI35_3971 [Cryptosporangiaceae bacterium]|nr:hypothetical protein [Cryptosporangiaceae bacterium]
MVHELPEARSLALDAANLLVRAAGTDAWPAVRRLFSRLFRRWDGRRRSIAEKGLNLTAEAMTEACAEAGTGAVAAAVAGPAAGPAAAENHVRTWHNRILALLAEHPGALDELRVIAGSHPELSRPRPIVQRHDVAVLGSADGNLAVGPR